jgi:hypothetical protein
MPGDRQRHSEANGNGAQIFPWAALPWIVFRWTLQDVGSAIRLREQRTPALSNPGAAFRVVRKIHGAAKRDLLDSLRGLGEGLSPLEYADSTLARRSRIHSPSVLRGFGLPAESGTGFSEKLLASIDAQLQKLKISACPFINLPEKTKGRRGLGIARAVMKRCEWVKPVLVAHEFIEITFFPHPGALHC